MLWWQNWAIRSKVPSMLDEVSPEAVHYGFAEMGVHLKSTDVLASLKKNRPERVQSHQYTDADGTRYSLWVCQWPCVIGIGERYAGKSAALHGDHQKRQNQGKTMTFTWITPITLTRSNIYGLMKVGRARWKIENATSTRSKIKATMVSITTGMATSIFPRFWQRCR